jgi:hypothetical protein
MDRCIRTEWTRRLVRGWMLPNEGDMSGASNSVRMPSSAEWWCCGSLSTFQKSSISLEPN